MVKSNKVKVNCLKREEKMKRIKRLLSCVLAVGAIVSCMVFSPSAATDDYAQVLRTAGFPESYIEPLCNLHDLHPNWTFTVHNITDLSGGKYTWDYVIGKEIEDQSNNLIDSYYTEEGYRLGSDTTADTGTSYYASKEAVEFFMDPRNFLNEDNIFQFTTFYYEDYMTVEATDAVLVGTFMHNAVIPDEGNTQTYAEYLVQIGKEKNLSPFFLAARLRLEQGVSGNLLTKGKVGTQLWTWYSNGYTSYDENGNYIMAPSSGYTQAELLKYDGYYNYFNINAGGTGKFAVYLGGAKEAYDGGWNTRKKAIAGGADTINKKYVSDGQTSPYYLKYNVHPASSRNFWGQYMQDITGAWNDGRSIRTAMETADILDSAHSFQIPVFSSMPATACPNPGTAFGNSTFIVDLDSPALDGTANKPTLYSETINLNSTTEYALVGWSVHSKSSYKFQYSVDNGTWVDLNSVARQDALNATGYTNCNVNCGFSGTVKLSELSTGTHQIVIRGKTTNNGYYLVARIKLDIMKAPYESAVINGDYTLDTASDVIVNIAAGTSANTLLENVYLKEGRVKILAHDGTTATGKLASGYKLVTYYGNEVKEEYTLIVTGDVNGDGIVNVKDLLVADAMKNRGVTEGYLRAVDVDNDKSISADELLKIRNSIS